MKVPDEISTGRTIKPLSSGLPYMQILNSVVTADKWIWHVYIIESLYEAVG